LLGAVQTVSTPQGSGGLDEEVRTNMTDRSGAETLDGKESHNDAARQSPPDRITVALIPKVGDELLRLQERTRLSKTDVVNRAITLYEFIDERTRAGQEILIRDKKTGETQTVVLL
jgi:hypothetical protein